MIEHKGVLIHLDPKGDRVADSELEFDGWVVTAADRSLKDVWLPATGVERLTTCDRPDVRRVFPNRRAVGFSGKCRERDIGPQGLRLALQVADEVFEVEYPLPAPLPASIDSRTDCKRWRVILARALRTPNDKYFKTMASHPSATSYLSTAAFWHFPAATYRCVAQRFCDGGA